MVVATGFFDGVHRGHAAVVEMLTGAARKAGTESVVVTFWPHPRTVLQQDARELRLLTTLEEKRRMLLGMGVDRVEVLGFSREFSMLTTEQYIRDILIGEMDARTLVLGYDNRIGSDLLDPPQVAGIARSLGLEVLFAPREDAGTLAVSSTRIRRALSEGDIPLAKEMLGYDYSLHGVVVSGNRKGRTLGFPTANMQLYEPLKLVPGRGVYLTEVDVLGRRYRGMTNIGLRPTLTKDTSPVVETHILDFDEDIYGLDIRVSFIRRIRSERRFPSAEALRDQLLRDRALCENQK